MSDWWIHVVFVQSLSRVRLCGNPWTAARQAPLSFTVSRSLLKFMSTESAMLSNHLTLCRPLLLLPSVFPSIRVFSSEPAPCIRWPKYWSFRFSSNPSNEYSGLLNIYLAVEGFSFNKSYILLPILLTKWSLLAKGEFDNLKKLKGHFFCSLFSYSLKKKISILGNKSKGLKCRC